MPQTTLVGLVLGDHAAAGGDDVGGAVGAVGAHAGEDHARGTAPQNFAAEENSGSTAGLQKLTGGPSSSAITGAVAPRDAHVAAAGRDIDRAGDDRLAVDALMRRPMAGAREMLGQDGGEGRRHVLGDQHRGAVDHRAEAGRPTALSACGPPVEAPISSTRGDREKRPQLDARRAAQGRRP